MRRLVITHAVQQHDLQVPCAVKKEKSLRRLGPDDLTSSWRSRFGGWYGCHFLGSRAKYRPGSAKVSRMRRYPSHETQRHRSIKAQVRVPA